MRPDDRRPGDTPPHAPSDDAQASGDGAARLGRERRPGRDAELVERAAEPRQALRADPARGDDLRVNDEH